MKNLKLLFACALLCGFALNSNAQSDTREFENYWDLYVTCDGVQDVISGPVNGHVVDHYNPVTGVFEWYKFVFQSNELVSSNTGEVFSVNFYQKGGLVGISQTTIRFNLIGNEGSHILVTLIWDVDAATGTWTLIKRTVKCL